MKPGIIARTDRIPNPFRAETYRTIIGLLASTGIRIGEALALDQTDLDHKAQLLTIRSGKFGKSRQVPLHSSTFLALERYSECRNRFFRRSAGVLAPLLQAFFTERLQHQRQVSRHTVCAYRRTFSLLLRFAQNRLGKAPFKLLLDEIDAPLVASFLHHLETERKNTVRTRNARLAAIHSFFRYIAVLAPEHAELVRRVLDIPQKRFERRLVDFLSRTELADGVPAAELLPGD